MIRKMQIADLPRVRACAERLQAKSPYADIPSDLRTFSSTIGQCINSAFGFAMVAERKGQIVGFMLGCAQPLWFSKKRSATDIVTYSEHPGDGLKLIRAFVDWAWSAPNVIEITMAQSSGIDVDRTVKLYERVGLERVGNIFTAVRQSLAAEVAA